MPKTTVRLDVKVVPTSVLRSSSNLSVRGPKEPETPKEAIHGYATWHILGAGLVYGSESKIASEEKLAKNDLKVEP